VGVEFNFLVQSPCCHLSLRFAAGAAEFKARGEGEGRGEGVCVSSTLSGKFFNSALHLVVLQEFSGFRVIRVSKQSSPLAQHAPSCRSSEMLQGKPGMFFRLGKGCHFHREALRGRWEGMSFLFRKSCFFVFLARSGDEATNT
jgi:hypothetical protein